jgi:ABC-type multidrug transport system ATPase subunit
MFDRLLLLEDGRVAFNGPVDAVVPYFSESGYQVWIKF